MVINVKEYYKPDNIDDAIALLDREKPLTRIISGGTGIVPNKNPNIEALVDITALNLSYINLREGNLVIGATTTLTQILKDDNASSWCSGLLKQACEVAGDTLLKNVVTIGGNIARPYTWCDLPIVLLGLDAVIHVRKQGKETITYKASEFFAQQPVNFLGKTDIITEIEIPALKGKGAFHKFARTKVDYALFDCMVYAEIEDGIGKDVRIALSGCINLPIRLQECENNLTGKKLTEEIISDEIDRAISQLSLKRSYIASNEYLIHVLKYYFKKLMLKLLEE